MHGPAVPRRSSEAVGHTGASGIAGTTGQGAAAAHRMPETGRKSPSSSRAYSASSERPAEPDARETKSRRHTPSGGDGAPGARARSGRMTSTLPPVSDWEFEQYVQAEVDGIATADQLAVLEA